MSLKNNTGLYKDALWEDTGIFFQTSDTVFLNLYHPTMHPGLFTNNYIFQSRMMSGCLLIL